MLLLGFSSLAYADFYVIPVPISKKIKNVITVAKSGGQFTDVKEAVDSITDANETNPYLVYIAPGHYNVTGPAIQMKPFVTIMGSGEKATVLEGSISTNRYDANSAIISGENNATLVNLAIVNTGGSEYSIGIYNYNVLPIIKDVTVAASGGTSGTYGIHNFYYASPTIANVTVSTSGASSVNIGIFNENHSSSTMTNVTVTAEGGSDNYAVANNGSSSPTMNNVTATASGGTNSYGVENLSASPTMTNVTARASGGSTSYGIHNNNVSYLSMINVTASAYGGSTSNIGVFNETALTLIMTNVTATASGGNFSYAVGNSNSSPTMTNVTATASGSSSYGVNNYLSSPIIRNSILNGDTNGINRGKASLSTVINGGGNGATCSYCVDENGTELDGNCVPK